LAASIQAEEDWNFADDASTSCAAAPAENDNTDEDEEMILVSNCLLISFISSHVRFRMCMMLVTLFE